MKEFLEKTLRQNVSMEESEYLNRVTQKAFDEICVSLEKTVETHDCIQKKANNQIILDLKRNSNLEFLFYLLFILTILNRFLLFCIFLLLHQF